MAHRMAVSDFVSLTSFPRRDTISLYLSRALKRPLHNGEATLLAKVSSCAIVGLDGALVDVEVDISNGQPGFTKAGSENQCAGAHKWAR